MERVIKLASFETRTVNSKLLVITGGNIDASNVDSLTSRAIYSRYIEAAAITGVTAAGAGFGLFIVTDTGGSAVRVGQYMFIPNSGYIASRYNNNGTWSSWKIHSPS